MAIATYSPVYLDRFLPSPYRHRRDRFNSPIEFDIQPVSDRATASLVLRHVGESFFEGCRLDQFVARNLNDLALEPAPAIDSVSPSSSRIVTTWQVVSARGELIGGMVVNFYTWDHLKRSLYFSRRDEHQAQPGEIAVRPIGSLVSSRLQPTEEPVAAIELAYFSVVERYRGLGIGRELFARFVRQVVGAQRQPTFCFTIVKARYATTGLGDRLMKHLLRQGPDQASSAVELSPFVNELHLPRDLFAADRAAIPTAKLAERAGWTPIGYGRHLGEVWAGIVSA